MRTTLARLPLFLLLAGGWTGTAPAAAQPVSTPPAIIDLHDHYGYPGTQVMFWMLKLAPGTNPASTGLTVTVDARPIGGAPAVPFVDQGFQCDDDTTDGVYFSCLVVPLDAPLGPRPLTVTVRDAQGRSSSQTVTFTVRSALPASWDGAMDGDGDSLPDVWETWYGLDPATAAGDQGAAGDPDGDGQSNLAELQAATHPRGLFAYHFAEGASNAFFATRLALFNPGSQRAIVDIVMLGANGVRSSTGATRGVLELAPHFHRTTQLDGLGPPDSAFSLVVESDQPLLVDRLVAWGVAPLFPGAPGEERFAEAYGTTLEQAIESPADTWYLAEGATGGPFSLYYLLENPGATAAEAVVTYLRGAPLAPIEKRYPLAPHTRVSLDVAGEDAGLAAGDVSAKITADQPIVVERAMYFSTPGQPFAAGHAGAGITAPATRWFLAEGSTGFFDEFVLIANAEPQDAMVTVTYLLPEGGPLSESIEVDAHSRFTIPVNNRFPALASTSVAIVVESPVPVVVERVMWWPHGQWYEASLSAGATATGTKWAFADGEVVAGRKSTYALIANTGAAAGQVTIKLYRWGGEPWTKTITLAGHSRTSEDLASIVPADYRAGLGFGVVIESDGIPIVVERAVYSTPANGPFWAAGAAALATRLQ